MTEEEKKITDEAIKESNNAYHYYKNMQFERLATIFERINKAFAIFTEEVKKLNAALEQFKEANKESKND